MMMRSATAGRAKVAGLAGLLAAGVADGDLPGQQAPQCGHWQLSPGSPCSSGASEWLSLMLTKLTAVSSRSPFRSTAGPASWAFGALSLLSLGIVPPAVIGKHDGNRGLAGRA
jgi:hypothetical protein